MEVRFNDTPTVSYRFRPIVVIGAALSNTESRRLFRIICPVGHPNGRADLLGHRLQSISGSDDYCVARMLLTSSADMRDERSIGAKPL